MLIYIFLFVFFLLGLLIKPKKQNFYFVISFVFLFILSAFRDISVGTDTESYEWLFNRVKLGFVLNRQEVGWYYFNKLILYLGGDFRWLIIISTLFILIPIFNVVRKYSLNPMLSIFLFYALYIYIQSFNITRQIISVSLVFASIPLLIKGKYKYYIISVFSASLFHATALLCLPLVFIKKIPYNKKYLVLMIFITLIFGTLLSNVLLNKIVDILGYTHYLSDGDSEDAETGLFLLLTNAFAVFLIATSAKNSIYLQLFFAYILFYNIIASVPFAYRLVYYFSVVQLLFLPYYVYNNKFKQSYLALFIVLVYATLFFIRTFGSAGVIPYKGVLF